MRFCYSHFIDHRGKERRRLLPKIPHMTEAGFQSGFVWLKKSVQVIYELFANCRLLFFSNHIWTIKPNLSCGVSLCLEVRQTWFWILVLIGRLLLVRFNTATCTFLLRLVKSVCWYYLLIHRGTSFLLRAPRIQQRCFRIRIKGKKKQRAGLCSLRHPFSSKSSVCTLGIFKNIILYEELLY